VAMSLCVYRVSVAMSFCVYRFSVLKYFCEEKTNGVLSVMHRLKCLPLFTKIQFSPKKEKKNK
jgi:hypothetical protein